MTLFDSGEARRLGEEGMRRAADARPELLRYAQSLARELAEQFGEVTSDDVAEAMQRNGIPYEALGNAAGSVFRGKDFEWTGGTVPSRRVSTHGRLIRVWASRKFAARRPVRT